MSRGVGGESETYIRPMYDMSWAPILGVLSQLLETYDDPDMVQLCLEGFQNSIRLSCHLEVEVSRRAYINALVNFTGLDAIRQIQTKNLESIKVLISIACTEGNSLEDDWCPILQCVSQLSRLQLAGEGLTRDEIFFADPNKKQENENESSILSTWFGTYIYIYICTCLCLSYSPTLSNPPPLYILHLYTLHLCKRYRQSR